MIKHLKLEHKGGYYGYRVHYLKLDKLAGKFDSLKNYLNEMFVNCPNEYFNNNGPRSSGLKFIFNNLKTHEVFGHEINDLCMQGVSLNHYKNAHLKVQMNMLENDDKTIAIETPIWIYPEELKYINDIFNAKSPLTGHIDLLRIEDEKIWVWDYKPNAFEEKYAVTQVYFYALMLSKRTKISLNNFRCGYFDEKRAYIFKPEINLLKEKPLLKFL